MIAHAGFSYDSPVSEPEQARWQAELDRVRVNSDAMSFLVLHWQAGDPWEPCGRWWIYDCLPAAVLRQGADTKAPIRNDSENADLLLLEELDGPNPRDRGNQYDSVLGRFIRNPETTIDRTQWVLWRELKALVIPFWVIQGTTGGHRWRFTDPEARALRAHGLPDEAPSPGSLPYAPFDGRVLGQLMRYDRLQRAEASLDRKLGRAADQRVYAQEIRALRANYLALLEDQIRDTLPMRANGPASACLDDATEHFINRGLVAA